MKNNSTISILFAFFMLTIMVYQVIEVFVDQPINEETIELTEFDDETESTEQENEQYVFTVFSASVRQDIIINKNLGCRDSSLHDSVIQKIPSPPPELA